MSEFPEWVERDLGLSPLTYRESRQLHTDIASGLWPDPRQDDQRVRTVGWRARIWFLNRRVACRRSEEVQHV